MRSAWITLVGATCGAGLGGWVAASWVRGGLEGPASMGTAAVETLLIAAGATAGAWLLARLLPGRD